MSKAALVLFYSESWTLNEVVEKNCVSRNMILVVCDAYRRLHTMDTDI